MGIPAYNVAFQAFQVLESPHFVTANSVLSVSCKHDACKIWFDIASNDDGT
jgi:hypothetical protein